MKLTLAEPKYLKDSIMIISELVNEASFKITQDGIELIAMDPANVAMVIFKLLSSNFTEYMVDKPTTIALNLGNFRQILRRAKPNDMISLELDSDNKLKIQLKGSSTRTFSMPLIDTDDSEQKVPQLEFKCEVNTTSNLFNDAIEDVEIIGDSVLFDAQDQMLNIVAESSQSKAKIEIKSADETKISVKDSQIKSKYSIEYLKKMTLGSKISDIVSLSFSQDYPLQVNFKVIDKVMLSFILAPRVDND